MKTLNCVVVFWLVLSISTFSQQDSTRGDHWINMSIPPFPEYNSFTFNFSLNYAIDNLAFNLMAFHAEGENRKGYNDLYELDSYSASIGYRLRYKYFMLASFIGLGYTRIFNIQQTPNVIETIGLISDIQIYTYPFTLVGIDGLGVGFELVSNFNIERNYNFYHLSLNYNF